MDLFFIYILKSSGALLLFFAIYKLFLQKETFFNANRSFLMIGLITSLIIPFIEFTKTVYIEAIPVTNVPFTASMTEVAIENKIDWLYITMIIYFLGVLFFSLRFIIQLLSLYKLINKGVLYKKYGFKFIETKENTSPFSFFNYIVYNPKKHTKEEIKTIIDHEKVHSSQNHSIDIIIAHLVSIFQWVNPIAWLYKKVIAQNLEYIADNHTTKKLDCTKNYQYLLLKQSSSNYNLSITNTFFNLLIKKRIVMLNKNKSQKQNAWKYGLILPLLSFFIFSFNVETVTTENNINNNLLTKSKLIEFNINKNTSDNELKKLAQKIKTEYNQDLIYDRVKRNSNGIITDIAFKYGDKKGFVNGNYNDKAGIPNIRFGTNNGEPFISFGKISSPTTLVKDIVVRFEGNNPIHILNGEKISKQEFEKLMLTPDQIEKIEVFKDEKAFEKYGDEAKNGVIEITTKKNKGLKLKGKSDAGAIIKSLENDANPPLYILKGKKITEKEMKRIKPENIKKINVLKGEAAIKKYGKDSKNGVVEITTKK